MRGGYLSGSRNYGEERQSVFNKAVCTPSHDKTSPIFSFDQEPVRCSFTWLFLNRVPLRMDFTEINSTGKQGELLGPIDRQNSRFRTAKTTIIKFGLHASFVELESAKSALNEPRTKGGPPRVRPQTLAQLTHALGCPCMPLLAIYHDIWRRLLIGGRYTGGTELGSDGWLLQQDNTPADTALSVKQFLTGKHITTMGHPPYSPDLANRLDAQANDKSTTILKLASEKAGWSNRRIGRPSVGRYGSCSVWQQWITEGRVYRRGGSGRPRNTNDREDRAIRRVATSAPTTSLASIQRHLPPSRHPVPSRETIRRRLTEVGLRSRRPLRRLPLTPHHRQCRLDFADLGQLGV
ncbi:hypothetical protein TNCV_4829121 [Trichonephila clavipes]|nr:hypothetical protein TNCV_4829121 [Trichonephila clavipes]